MIWIGNLVRVITINLFGWRSINLARDSRSIFFHPFAQSAVENPHIACAEVTEQESGAGRGVYPDFIVADDAVISLDVQSLHLVGEAFEAGKSVDILAGLGNLIKIKQNSVGSEPLSLE